MWGDSMKRVLLSLGFVVSALLLTVTSAHADQSTAPGQLKKKTAPEIDPMVAGSVLTLLAGGTFLIDSRLRNKARGRK